MALLPATESSQGVDQADNGLLIAFRERGDMAETPPQAASVRVVVEALDSGLLDAEQLVRGHLQGLRQVDDGRRRRVSKACTLKNGLLVI